MAKKLLSALALFLIVILISPNTWARKSQLHVRTGLLSGSYQGTFDGEFAVATTLDVDYEIFLSNLRSVHFRFTQALDFPDSVPFYTYGGVGMRFYKGGKGMYSFQEDQDIYISSVPTWRYYLGADFGIAQVVVESFGTIVQAVSNMLDIGGNVGVIYQVDDSFGLEVQTGLTIDYGISSTAEVGYTGRLFLGGTYYF